MIVLFHNGESSGRMCAVLEGGSGFIVIDPAFVATKPHWWRLDRAEAGAGIGPWWTIANDWNGARFVTASDLEAENGGIRKYKVRLEKKSTDPDRLWRQQWFFEPYPNDFDQTTPLFGSRVRIWNRAVRATISFDPPYSTGGPLFARDDPNEGLASQWFATVRP